MKGRESQETSDKQSPQNTLRLKAGVIIAILTILIRFVIPPLVPSAKRSGSTPMWPDSGTHMLVQALGPPQLSAMGLFIALEPLEF